MKMIQKSRCYQSGFRAKVITRLGFKQKFLGIMVDFGSSDQEQLAGGAHFLEHRLFAKKDADLSDAIEALGGESNAFTAFNETMFYCTTTRPVNRFLPLLFRLVGEPDFTTAGVKKEIPIIQQELAMYQNDPSWQLNQNLMQRMFPQQLLGLDVAGTQASIAAFTATELKRIYQEHYQAQHMALVVVGDFTAYQRQNILRLAGQLQKQYLKARPLAKLHSRQSFTADQIQASVNPELFALSLKLPNFKKVLASFDLAQNLLGIMLESKLSVMSPWFSQMKRQGLLASPLQVSVEHTRQGDFTLVFGLSSQPQAASQAIKQRLLADTKNEAFSQSFFQMQQKRLLANLIRRRDNLEELAIASAEDLLHGENSEQAVLQLGALTFDQYYHYCQELEKGAEIFVELTKEARK